MKIPSLIPAGQLQVKFTGERGGEGPLTWGQSNTLRWSSDKEQYYRMIEWIADLPAGTTLDDIAAAFSTLMARHESLRTMYPGERGQIQRVAQSGELAIDLYEIDGEPGDCSMVATDLVRRLRAVEFDLSAELPLRVAVATTGGVARVVAIVYSHVAADFASMAVVGAQFTVLAGDPTSREAGPPGHQPLDQAAAERSERGRRRAQAAMRYWESQIWHKPQCLYAVPPDELDHHGGPLSGWLWSRAAAMALARIAARTGASRQMVVLAALCAVIARRTAQSRCVFLTRTSNRYERRLREYVGSLAHDTLVAVDTRVHGFDELVRQAGTGTLRAATNGLIGEADVLRAVAEIDHHRGVAYSRDCVFNDLSSADPARAHLVTAPADPAGIEHALAQTTLRWVNWAEVPQLLLFNLVQVDGELILGALTASTRRMPRREIELLLRGTERLLVAAAAADIGLNRVGEITGIEQVHRGPGWFEVGSCWIELPEVQRLVNAALRVQAARVFALPDGRGSAATLVAYLAGETIRTPEQAHAACMEMLPGRYTAIAPGRYVICEQSPDDPSDLAGWLSQTVLAEGSGRGEYNGGTAAAGR
jgi:hypothetical protein